MRKSLYILGVLIVALGVLVLMQAGKGKSRPLADTVTVSFLGYTNDSSGARAGLFKVTNPCTIAVDLREYHDVQLETEAGWTSQGLQPAATAVIDPKQTVVLQIGAPRAKQRWRVWLNYEDHRDFEANFALKLKRLGLPVSFQNQSYSACSAPIDP